MFIDKAYGYHSVGEGRDSCTKWGKKWFYRNHACFDSKVRGSSFSVLSWSCALLSALDAGSFRVLYSGAFLPRVL